LNNALAGSVRGICTANRQYAVESRSVRILRTMPYFIGHKLQLRRYGPFDCKYKKSNYLEQRNEF